MLSVADGQRFGNKTSILLSGFYFLPFSSYPSGVCAGQNIRLKEKGNNGPSPTILLLLYTDPLY
jgi:hypothetical protein